MQNEIGSSIRRWFDKAFKDVSSRDYSFNLILAFIIGIIGGYGAVGFRLAIQFVQKLGFGVTEPTIEYMMGIPWYMKLGLPIVGAVLVGIITTRFAAEAKGHGVPEVMAAVGTKGGVIRPRVAAAKVLASAICIGTGGSAGREGPIVQIGSAVASSLGQFLKLSPRRLKTLVGCGAAAGIAATFNAPVAGMLFALEIILGDFGMSQLSPIILASVVATAVSRMHLGDIPAFVVPEYSLQSPFELVHYALLGLAAGVVAVMFTTSLHSTEMFFKRVRLPDWLKPTVGALIIGLMAVFGLPHIFGVGYDLIEAALRGELALSLLAILVLAKIVSTSATLGSGGSGGIFAPSLYMGAMLGGVVWYGAHFLTPDLVFPNHGAYSLVGMAAVVAGTTRAPLQAILILFELTGGYEVILPLMLSSIIAVLVGRLLYKDSIYTVKLRSKGIVLKQGQEVNVLKEILVEDVYRTEKATVPYNMRLRPLMDTVSDTSFHSTLFVLNKEQKLSGFVSFHEIRQVLFDIEALEPVLVVNDIADRNPATVHLDDNLDTVMRLFGTKNLDELPVVSKSDPTELIGSIHRADVIAAYNNEIMKRDLMGSMASSVSELSKVPMAQLAPGFSMAEIELPPHLGGKDLKTLDLRNKHSIEVILVRRNEMGNTTAMVPTPDLVLEHGDTVLISGPKEIVDTFANK